VKQPSEGYRVGDAGGERSNVWRVLSEDPALGRLEAPPFHGARQ
jgi:hypothetical protein